MLKIYLTNLGKYNEGFLVGEWVTLPVSDEELEAVLERIGISEDPDENGNYYEETFITDYETDIEGLNVGEYDSISDLNDLAESVEGLDSYEETALEAFLENGCSFEEALENVKDGNYRIYSDCHDMTDVAYEVVEELDYLHGVPENIARYFDYESFGRDLGIEGTFIFIGCDCIELIY